MNIHDLTIEHELTVWHELAEHWLIHHLLIHHAIVHARLEHDLIVWHELALHHLSVDHELIGPHLLNIHGLTIEHKLTIRHKLTNHAAIVHALHGKIDRQINFDLAIASEPPFDDLPIDFDLIVSHIHKRKELSIEHEHAVFGQLTKHLDCGNILFGGCFVGGLIGTGTARILRIL